MAFAGTLLVVWVREAFWVVLVLVLAPLVDVFSVVAATAASGAFARVVDTVVGECVQWIRRWVTIPF